MDPTGKDLALELDYATKAEGAYPIVLVTYEITCTTGLDASRLDLVKSFLTYTSSEAGQQILVDNGYAPLPEEIRSEVAAAVAAVLIPRRRLTRSPPRRRTGLELPSTGRPTDRTTARPAPRRRPGTRRGRARGPQEDRMTTTGASPQRRTRAPVPLPPSRPGGRPPSATPRDRAGRGGPPPTGRLRRHVDRPGHGAGDPRAIGGFLVYRAVPALQANTGNFLTTKTWFPNYAPPVFGIAALAFGTLLSIAIALVMAVPVAIGVALFISHYAPRRLAAVLGYVIDLLAAVPSVVYGLWGL